MVGRLTSIEVCAGAGGQAAGLEQAGFEHLALVEIDRWACQSLRTNRPRWNVIGPGRHDRGGEGKPGDLRAFSAEPWNGQVSLLSGGVPCPPFSVAGRQLGRDDERDLFPEMLRLTRECRPSAVMIENVRGILASAFDGYRAEVTAEFAEAGYRVAAWELLQASQFGVPQLRPRAVLVAFAELDHAQRFSLPIGRFELPPTVGEALLPLMAAGGWEGAAEWAKKADRIAPTLVGGSQKHGGPDLGPTRAKRQWAAMGVDGLGLADAPPPPGFSGNPRLTVQMTARLQGFDPSWKIEGAKTPAYRQIGNAFPPPVAIAVGQQIRQALDTPTRAAGATALAA